MELELCGAICSCYTNLQRPDKGLFWIERALEANKRAGNVVIDDKPDENLKDEPLWCGQGQRICGEQFHTSTGDAYPTQESWDKMINHCIASAHFARNESLMLAARMGLTTPKCAHCKEDVEGLIGDPLMKTCDLLKCRHFVHKKYILGGLKKITDRSWGIGWIDPGTTVPGWWSASRASRRTRRSTF